MKEAKRVIIASNNKNKIKEIKEYISKNIKNSYLNKLDIITMEEAGIWDEVIEDGNTLFENAYKKAKYVADICPEDIVLGEDTGLFVDALPDLLGVKSKRLYSEPSINNITTRIPTYLEIDPENEFGFNEYINDINNEILLRLLIDLKTPKERSAFFETVIVIMYKGRFTFVNSELYGHIHDECIGDNGWAYDKLFVPKNYDEYGENTLAQLSDYEKSVYSMRGLAIWKLNKAIEHEINEEFISSNMTKSFDINIDVVPF